MPNIGPLGNIKIVQSPTVPVGDLGTVTKPVDSQPTVSTGPSLPPKNYDHGLLSGLNDDDHPQYLRKAEAELLYQPLIYIGSTPPVNPPLNAIWIQI